MTSELPVLPVDPFSFQSKIWGWSVYPVRRKEPWLYANLAKTSCSRKDDWVLLFSYSLVHYMASSSASSRACFTFLAKIGTIQRKYILAEQICSIRNIWKPLSYIIYCSACFIDVSQEEARPWLWHAEIAIWSKFIF